MSQPTRLANGAARRRAGGRPANTPGWFDARLNDAAMGVARFVGVLRRSRRLRFVEHSDGSFAREGAKPDATKMFWRDGSFIGAPSWRKCEVEFRLSPSRCVFRELEFPARAAEFLEGVVRAQIDRITPWRPNEAAFGWSQPHPLKADRITVWVAATKLAPILDLAQAAEAAGAKAVIVTTVRVEDSGPVTIFNSRATGASDLRRWRLALVVALFAAIAAALAATVAQMTLGVSLDDQIETQSAELIQSRTALLRRERAGDNPATQAIESRKRETPSAVIALDALSNALPDQAYLTEMRLEGEKLDIAGVAANAADLIHAIESSSYFSQATFTAPTTRAADGSGETFQIEAHVAPHQKSPP